MPIDYSQIKAENITRYGTDIGRIGPMLLANRYDDRSHFIFELLQNAEDALKRRDSKEEPHSVQFQLSQEHLSFSHFGRLFSEADVRGICGIGESTKADDLTAIGRFGIGFKAVYAFTDSPEIHSGNESFAIDSFVWPRAIDPTNTLDKQTVFKFPLRPDDNTAHDEIAAGLQRLGVRTLLFLREIDEISWAVDSGASGEYLRHVEHVSPQLRRVTVVGHEVGSSELIEERWFVFSREVLGRNGTSAGYVEVAFALDSAAANGTSVIRPVPDSKLVVFFPTIVGTNLGCLLQGPYRTTPSRDNVPRNDEWNQHLVAETASLFVEALRELRDMKLLSVDALRTLPIDTMKFPETSMFSPLFRSAKTALTREKLLPCFPEGYVEGRRAKIARTQELRALVSPPQLAKLYRSLTEIHWLDEGITRDRTPELRQYLVNELGIAEIEPENFLPKISKSFLEAQTDTWIAELYVFLLGQSGLRRQGALTDKPIIRLQDGTHVVASINGQPQAFLPSPITTDFPAVKSSICDNREVVEFLKQLGLSEPDPVDDVVKNLLPKYRQRPATFSGREYEHDIKRILNAFITDSKKQRDKLVAALRDAFFIVALETKDASRRFVKPDEVYLATQRLKKLFRGVPGVLLVDDTLECLRGEASRNLLESSGVTEYLQPIPVTKEFTHQELIAMRQRSGDTGITSGGQIEDYTLRGLHELLIMFPSLPVADASERASLLWDALCDVQDRRGASVFSGMYRWRYYYDRSSSFDASFVHELNQTAWVPTKDNSLQASEFVVFEELSPPWKDNPFLLSKIRFKPPIIHMLAREVGIEPGVLDLLKKVGLTSEADLRAKLAALGIIEPPPPVALSSTPSVDDAIKKIGVPDPTPPIEDSTTADLLRTSGTSGGTNGKTSGSERGERSTSGPVPGDRSGHSGADNGKRTLGTTDSRPFISYVGVLPEEDEPDPDGLQHAARMALEENAIALILEDEPFWKRTPAQNPGFDLFETGSDGRQIRWCEVKAMTGSLTARPVGMSRTQYDFAQKQGAAYWLYVVERVATDNPRIVRIQDPAGKVRTYTFDHGWLNVAEVSDVQERQKD